MLPISLTVQLATADDDGVAQNQTPGAAGDLTLNGVLVSGGVATLTTGPAARQVLITCASDESAKTITIYGTDANGNAISEQVIGPDGTPTTATTVQFFKTVTRVAVSAAFTGNIKVGTNGVGGSRIMALDQWASSTSVQVDVAGTVNFTVQSTNDDIMNTAAELVTWINYPAAALAAAATSAQGSYIPSPAYLRMVINSGTGAAQINVRQSLY